MANWSAWVAGAIIAAAPVGALAQEPPTNPEELSIEERATAARLADEGMAFFDKGDFTSAVDRFEKAGAIVRVPTIVLQHGRALERLGRWVQATEKYREVAQTPITATTPWQHRGAKANAQRELTRLDPKIPRLKFVVRPAASSDPEISVDGRLVPDVGSGSVPVDPGEHVIDARRPDGTQARVNVNVKPETETIVELELERPAPRASAPPPEPGRTLHPIEIAGWSGIGVGGACLLVATFTGIPAIAMKDDLEQRCPDRRCPETEFDDVETYDGLRWTAGVALFVGLGLGGGGVAAVLLAPKSDERAARVRPWITAGLVGVEGDLP